MKPALIKVNIAVFLWGFTGVLGRAISLNEGWLVWWRMLLTVISMWIFFSLLKKIEKLTIRQFLSIGGIGVLLALHWLCFYGSIKYSNVSISLTCLSSSAFASAILEPMFFGKKINPKELLYGTLTIAGIVLVYYGNMHFSAGVYIGLAAMLLSVLVSLFSKRIVNDYKPETFVLYQLTGGFIGLSLLMPVYHHLFPAENIIPQKFDWLWLLLLAWVCTIFTFVLYTDSLKSISAFTANITLTLEPVYGIILAFILYKENKDLSSVFYIGFICILLAVILQTRSITRKPQDKMLQE